MEAELFGREVTFEYSETWIGYSMVVLRVVMGWVLFQGGVTKLVTYLDADPANDWTAAATSPTPSPRATPSRGRSPRWPVVR